MAATTGESLSVIALISGGKDSFYSILHCQANGHRVVALANLHPSGAIEDVVTTASQQDDQDEASAASSSRQQCSSSQSETGDADVGATDGETDLNSFMYQTVGHQLIPLYARATGLPLYRQAIVGTAVHHGLSYENPSRRPQRLQGPVASDGPALELEQGSGPELELELEVEVDDETESLVPLLHSVLKAHPEANALCTGAILSTYQRTRVESVALRLGLVPLSYLWQFTELPMGVPSSCRDQVVGLVERVRSHDRDVGRRARRKGPDLARDDARLLRDMAAVGLEARIVKVASAGLDEGFLWENVASEAGVQRVERAMRRFGAAAGGRGSILGEGGEFETLVVDGPPSLFRGRIVPSDEGRRVVREGGGCVWLSFRRATVVPKGEAELERAGESQGPLAVPIPGLLDPRFEDTIRCLLDLAAGDNPKPGLANPSSSYNHDTKPASIPGLTPSSDSIAETGLPKCQLPLSPQSSSSQEWRYFGSDGASSRTVQEQTVSIVSQIRRQLDEHALPASAITNSVIVLRHMSDFPLVNEHYGSLFYEPNPPSRVTISCGDELLPRDAAIAVYLTVHTRLSPHERRGLHVQSRSYWAPANIGPYSQAIAFPLLPPSAAEATRGADGEDEDEDEDERQHSRMLSSPVAVSIAGQIPLLPASMALPPSSMPHNLELQITLALQHLWRVGVEMQVRWWTSAVAYFPATSSTEVMRRQALLAATAWKAAHLWPDVDNADKESDERDTSDDDDDDDDEAAGPDLWDRRFNARFMTYGGGEEEESFPLSLPNWSVVKGVDAAGGHDDDDDDGNQDTEARLRSKIAKLPFFFAAEVEELPRQAGVEWHAHLGLADVRPESVTLHTTLHASIPSHEVAPLDISLHHVIVDSGDAVFVQTTAVIRPPADHEESQRMSVSVDALRRVFDATADSLGELFSLKSRPSVAPKITYADALRLADDDDLGEIGALVPCHSLWDSRGRRPSAVCVFETRMVKSK
ncbi:hypothetical protein F5B17DRAFT_292614 [Nemania serpens]|nr:hypothetical protein F5B17DRAFT_292614 [Nemania serpens]